LQFHILSIMEYSNQQLINGIRQSDAGIFLNTIKTRMKMSLAYLRETEHNCRANEYLLQVMSI
jgi:hypothetical protein